MIQRTLEKLLRPRQTGKSTLVAALKPDLTINLAHEPTFLEFARNPEELEQRLGASRNLRTVFLDEIQSILDRGGAPRFYLTGSSARKLRRGHANLLPDRSSRVKTLSSYCATYLKEEIQAEALARNIEGFSSPR